MNFPISYKKFDLVVIGSGGAGLMAAISSIDSGLNDVAIISKLIPTSSHTVAAKGGINASLGNSSEDDWKWHAYDTIKGGDYLCDVDAVEVLCKNANQTILDLEKMGVVFSRNQNGEIIQRPYGGQMTNFGEGVIANRACYAKDKTGHTILHSLYQQAIKRNVKFFSEFFVIDLLIDENQNCLGCLAIDLNQGELVVFQGKITVIATGGYGQIYQNTTSALSCTGDGSYLVFKEGLPLQDMEFVQFHPTGIFGSGLLITEAARGEGAYLLNSLGERFMKNYAPKMLELASRDVISQAISTEINEGRGCGNDKNFIHLDLRHLSDEILQNKIPGVVELIKNFTNLDIKKDLIPISPSAHYTMGGIPCNKDCEVLEGLMAVGEVACISVHGANRLGCNSLLDIVVFGKICGQKSAQKILENNLSFKDLSKDLIEKKISKLQNIFSKNSQDNSILSSIKSRLQEVNEKHIGVFREEFSLKSGMKKILELISEFKKYRISNQSLIWNEELTLYFEIESLLLNSLATFFAAINRKESRGAHYRFDFKNRDDEKFLFHSLVKIKNISQNFDLDFSLKEVNRNSKIQELNIVPKSRKY